MRKMRSKLLLSCGLSAILLTGCQFLLGCMNTEKWKINSKGPGGSGNFEAPATAPELIGILNSNTKNVQSLYCKEVYVQVQQDGQSIGTDGYLLYEKPRNFRLILKGPVGTEADFGSNTQEFWFHVKRQSPSLYFCQHDQMQNSRANLPVQPDWIGEAMSVQELNPADGWQSTNTPDGLHAVLRKRVSGNKGEPMVKSIYVARKEFGKVAAGKITQHRLDTADGKEIFTALIQEYQTEAGMTYVPYKVQVNCKNEKLTMNLKLNGCQLNIKQRDEAFVRPSGYQAVNLAGGQVASPNGSVGLNPGGKLGQPIQTRGQDE